MSDGGVQHLCLPDRCIAARRQEVWWITSDDLRQAALDTDLPDGSTMLGLASSSSPRGSPMAGQNERAYPVVVQYSDDQSHVVWPKAQQQREPVLKLPGSSPYALK